MTSEMDDRLDERSPLPRGSEPADLADLTPEERADLEAFVADEAAEHADEDLPPVEVAASMLAAQSDVLDDATSLTSTDDPPLGPLTLKEAYGESIGAALNWSPEAQLCAAYSGGEEEETFVDRAGLCAYWSFTYTNGAGQFLDLVIVNGQVEVSDYEFDGAPGSPFALEDLLDSPEIVDRAFVEDLVGEELTLDLERDENGMLRAIVVSGEQRVVVNPVAKD